ncbi:MAG: ubiquitin-like domain-containing protein [Candidatus Odinarchaeia archaeon]
MKIFVVSAIGGSKDELEFEPHMRIRDIKQKISQLKRLPEDTFVLAFKGKQLDENLTIKEAGINNKDKIYLIVRTEGG